MEVDAVVDHIFLEQDPGPLPGRKKSKAKTQKSEPVEKMDRPAERRSDPRYEVTAKAYLTIFADKTQVATGKASDLSRVRLVREGYTNNLSMSGVCVVLDSRVGPLPIQLMVGQRIKLRLEFDGGDEDVNILGRVTWVCERNRMPSLGIQFTEMPERDRAMLQEYCKADEGALNRLSNLWQVLVAERDPSPPTE